MIDHILDRYTDVTDLVVLVVEPAAHPRVAGHLRGRRVAFAEQETPTGMLDAILCGREAVLAGTPDRIWITWCDQIGISAATVETLARLDEASPDAAVIFPTVVQTPPYIHFERDRSGRLIDVRQRREGDDMPLTGTSDAGLFSLSRHAFADLLPEFARTAPRGRRTAEVNFLPFIPWVAAHASVATFTIPPDEARGINTPEDLAAVERRLT